MRLFADSLRPPAGGSVRDGVIGDLAEYFQLSPEQVVHRCLHWEDESVQEWRASRDAPEGLAQFYDSVQSCRSIFSGIRICRRSASLTRSTLW